MNPEPLRIRPATPADLAGIAQIQAACPELAPWQVRDYFAYDCRVAISGGHLAGFAVARRLADDESELLNLAVDPGFRRQGIAGRLLSALTNCYPGTVWLEVRESNAPARNFYKTQGFQETGRRPQYYGDSQEPAIVMKFHS